MQSLTLKLILAFLVVSLAGVGLFAGLVWFSNARQFDQFLVDRAQSDFAAYAESYYLANHTWDGLAGTLEDPGRQNLGHGGSHGQGPVALADQNNRVVIGGGRFHVGDLVAAREIQQGVPIVVDGLQVGTALNTGAPPTRNPLEESFMATTNQALVLAALGAALIALGLGVVLARTITSPVRELTRAVHAMAKGQIQQKVEVRSQDEIGELTSTFNRMSADLQRSNELRRQMTADIAHDLRTPLTVISGYLESLRDGVLKPSPERFDILYAEARQLQRLVEDLRTLSLAEAGELTILRQALPPAELLNASAAAFQHQAEQRSIRLLTEVEPNTAGVEVDPERMSQVLGNLVSNALRYTPDGGEIRLRAFNAGQRVVLSVQDSGAGITEEVLKHVFDRFYRGDESRQGSESGLGLAIARAIVELHGGKISASSAGPGQGAVFSIQLPAVKL